MGEVTHSPIRRRLTRTILVICGAALVVACVALGIFEYYDFRSALARDTTVLADILGSNSGGVLSFNDDVAAREMLAAVASEPHVAAARLFQKDGAPFVDYMKDNTPSAMPVTPGPDGAHFRAGFLEVFRPVRVNDRRVGTIFILADLDGIKRRLGIFAVIASIVILFAFGLAFILSGRLQRPITQPILQLAETAARIAEQKDYSVRATGPEVGEVGLLTKAFNTMLTGIEQRDTALNATNEQLRLENTERMQAEAKATAQVGRLAQMNQITRAIGERQDVESIFQAVVGNLESHMPIDFGCVCLFDHARNQLTVTSVGSASAALAMQLAMPEKAEIPIDANGLSRCTRGELVYENDVGKISLPFPRRLAAGGLRSVVFAPLLVESQVFGVLLAARRQPNGFTSGDCEFIRQLSEHVALAAHQAQLNVALQRAYDDLRQTQQVVMQQERLRALGQMASGIAHDINNAISPISLYVESILEKEPNLSRQTRDWLQTVQRAIEDVAHTVARMKEFYRQREPQLTFVAIPANRVVEQVADLTRARWFDMAQQRGAVIDLRREFDPALPPIMGVESEIREALINLVFNAIDALPRGGTLTLRTRKVGRSRADGSETAGVAIEVCDSGVGMDEETQRRCMEPFFTTKGERGTGLGLAMVYGIVKRHNAEIEIESAPGKGTTMRIIFAIAAATDLVHSQGGGSNRPNTQLRILVVDDDPLLVKSIREILEGDGHLVTTANGGQAGINGFTDAHRKPGAFSVVITDLGMPYVDGRKVASAVKTLSPLTPVFLLTGWGNRLLADGDLPPHVDRILSKPPKLRELREALSTVAPQPD